MTPLMRQYWDIKSAHEDKVLLFRMGDFFEMFFDDAVKAAPIVGIALTQRNKKSADETPMCGVPHHSVAGPINKLLKAGLKVAICDQIEDPKLAKGIVKRAVTRVLTPGMVYDSETLAQNESNYLACVEGDSLACVETSTGEGFYFEGLDHEAQSRLISVLPIAELVVADKSATRFPRFSGLLSEHASLLEGSHVSGCVQRLLSYVQSLGGNEALKTLKPFERKSLQKRLDLSPTVLRHLEIFATYKGEGSGSLLTAMDRTRTSAGARTLRSWMSFPLTDLNEIQLRQNRVEAWTKDPGKLKQLREVLAQMGDLERRLGKIAQPQCNGRDLQALASAVEAGLSALQIAGEKFSGEKLHLLKQEIESTLNDEQPLLTRQGHLIRRGFSPELDELIALSTDSQTLLQQMEEAEKAKTGISSLKIRYNSVFGYYIEITNTHKEKVPSRYLRKQTLTNAERYCTDELIELEKKVLSAQGKRAELEYAYFEELKRRALEHAQGLLGLATATSELDVISSLAWLAIERRYVRPQFVESQGLNLRASRHPVVEQMVKHPFVPNDIRISDAGCMVLTGPNMAGKSTIMRQVALTAILAQMGSFVPADEAKLPVFDHIFTRIGASDQLSEGLSTFMVEMTETAEMLQKSTNKSLLILDEIGRGTSTYDGMALAQSILEHLLTEKKAMALFATHYHELTLLSNQFPKMINAHMTVLEKSGEIRFLHTLAAGPAQKSYGIQVARLAGMPPSITQKAMKLLSQIENSKERTAAPENPSMQMSLMELVTDSTSALQERIEQLETIVETIRQFPVSMKTPVEALVAISELQKNLVDNQDSHGSLQS